MPRNSTSLDPVPTSRFAAPSAVPRITVPLLVVLSVVLLSGGLFGYDQGVISGALAGIRSTFALGEMMVQVVTSWVTLGALLGSLLAGELADRLGRRKLLMLAVLLLVAGALVQYLASGVPMLVAGRLLVGAGVGATAVAGPLYAAELAPAWLRGRFVAGYQLAITTGIFLAYAVNERLTAGAQWRVMLGVVAIPGIALLLVTLRAPESPRWLLMRGRRVEARSVLRRLQPDGPVDGALAEVEAALREESRAASWRELFRPEWRRPLMIAFLMAVFQQVTGINAIIYYANQVFAMAGFETDQARAAVTTWAVGGVNLLATFIAIAFIDKLGRRKLLLAGLVGMAVSLAVLGAAFRILEGGVAAVAAAGAGASVAAHAGASLAANAGASLAANAGASVAAQGPGLLGWVAVGAVIGFITCFAFSLGPVGITVVNEVFPARVRSRGVAFAMAVNWSAAWAISQFFLTLVSSFGGAATFWLMGILCVVGCIWVWRAVPETKGKSLEEIEALWRPRTGPSRP